MAPAYRHITPNPTHLHAWEENSDTHFTRFWRRYVDGLNDWGSHSTWLDRRDDNTKWFCSLPSYRSLAFNNLGVATKWNRFSMKKTWFAVEASGCHILSPAFSRTNRFCDLTQTRHTPPHCTIISSLQGAYSPHSHSEYPIIFIKESHRLY